MGQIVRSKLNPQMFFQIGLTQSAQYNTKRWEDYVTCEIDNYFTGKACYQQRWQQNDTIKLQFESSVAPIQYDLFNESGVSVYTSTFTAVRQHMFDPTLQVYEIQVPLSGIAEGYYLPVIKVAGDDNQRYRAHCIDVRTRHRDTVCIKYSHRKFTQDVIFETGIIFEVRVEGWIGSVLLGERRSAYSNSLETPFVIKTKRFNSYPVYFGGQTGIPSFMVDLLGDIWALDNVSMEGKLYAKIDEGGYSYVGSDVLDMRQLSFTIRDGINRSSIISDSVQDHNKKLLIVHNLDPNIHGNIGSSTANTLQITKSEP